MKSLVEPIVQKLISIGTYTVHIWNLIDVWDFVNRREIFHRNWLDFIVRKWWKCSSQALGDLNGSRTSRKSDWRMTEMITTDKNKFYLLRLPWSTICRRIPLRSLVFFHPFLHIAGKFRKFWKIFGANGYGAAYETEKITAWKWNVGEFFIWGIQNGKFLPFPKLQK